MLLPICTMRTTLDLVVQMTFPYSTILSSNCSKTSELPVFVDRLAYPVDPRVTTDSLVLRVDHDHLEEFEGGILGYPVGAKNTKSTTVASCSFLKYKGNKEFHRTYLVTQTILWGVPTSATERRLLWNFNLFTPCLTGFPCVFPLGTFLLRPPRRIRTR